MHVAEKYILNVVGNPASGKDSYVEHLVHTRGAVPIGASAIIRAFAEERGLPTEQRVDMIAATDRMNQELGPYYMADQILQTPGDFICVAGLRVVPRQQYLHKHGAESLALWGSPYTRFRNSQNAPRSRGSTIREFYFAEIPEYFGTDPNLANTIPVMMNAHYHVSIENRTQEEVAQAADALILPELIRRGLAEA